MTNIVTVNVSQQVAPTPDTLQKTGAFISQHGTTLADGARQLITQMADLTDILRTPAAVTSAAWSGGTVTITTTEPHGISTSTEMWVVIAGFTPSAYNGTYLATFTGASTFTYALVSDPGNDTVQGTWLPRSSQILTAMGTTFFAQGNSQSVYVLELGAGDAADGVTALTTYITANPGFFYSYLVPDYWADESTFVTMVDDNEAPTAKTYFHVTAALDNYTDFLTMKAALVTIPAPDAPITEWTAAAGFFDTLAYDPSTTNKVTPLCYRFVYGVTAYPTVGNAALLATLKAANVNIIGTGNEGGISNTILLYGTTMDGNDFTYWYSIDWVQVTADQFLANAIINGSNNPVNPLYYNQDGVNRLQSVLAGVMSSGVTFGLVLGNVAMVDLDGTALIKALDSGDLDGKTVVNAVPFIPYSRANPTHYAQGIYNGLSVSYTPTRGFKSITINVVVSQFVVQ